MAQPTQQDKAITTATEVVALASNFRDLLHQAQDLSARITANNYLSVLDALPTAIWAADGTVGDADTTPDGQHPITTQGLYLAANDVTGGVYMLNDFVLFMTNGTVSSNDRVAVVSKLVR